MIRFELLEPKDLAEACSLLSEHKGRARIIAGGHGLLPLLKHRLVRPAHVVNIKNLPGLDYIRDNGGGIAIGALTTNRAIEVSPLIKEKVPMLAELEKMLGDTQTRNWGTAVGNLCMASPTSDLAPALIALGASLTAMSVRGKREIPLEAFLLGYMKTALEPDEIVIELRIPSPLPHSGGVYHKERVRLTDSPIASAAAVVRLDNSLGTVTMARIVLQAVCPAPLRAIEAEELVTGKKVRNGVLDDAVIAKVAAAAAKSCTPISDVYGSADYKREMVRVMTGKVVAEAAKRAYSA